MILQILLLPVACFRKDRQFQEVCWFTGPLCFHRLDKPGLPSANLPIFSCRESTTDRHLGRDPQMLSNQETRLCEATRFLSAWAGLPTSPLGQAWASGCPASRAWCRVCPRSCCCRRSLGCRACRGSRPWASREVCPRRVLRVPNFELQFGASIFSILGPFLFSAFFLEGLEFLNVPQERFRARAPSFCRGNPPGGLG